MKILILEKLPLDNYHLLKYLIQFLSKVSVSYCLSMLYIIYIYLLYLHIRIQFIHFMYKTCYKKFFFNQEVTTGLKQVYCLNIHLGTKKKKS